MADCSYARCVQERRFIKRELQKWTKDMVHIVGLERVAEELMGRRKWKLYQEILARSHSNSDATATATSDSVNINQVPNTVVTDVHCKNNGQESLLQLQDITEKVFVRPDEAPLQQQQQQQQREQNPLHTEHSVHSKQLTTTTTSVQAEHQTKTNNIRGSSGEQQSDTAKPTVAFKNESGKAPLSKSDEANLSGNAQSASKRNGRDDKVKSPPLPTPVDWKPQENCYFCVDGKLLTVNDKGDLVAESGSVHTGPDLASRAILESDSDSSDCSESEVIFTPPNKVNKSSVADLLRASLPQQSNMTSLESMAAQLATIASLNGFPPIYPGLLYNPFVQQMHSNPSAESTSAASPIAKPSPSPVEAGTTEQPLDLSAKPSTTPTFSNDPKQVYRAKPRVSAAPGRKTYTEDELQHALQDILSGKLGTRRAAVMYGIPRSTLRNKVYKLAMEQKREASLLLPQSSVLDALDADDDDKELSGGEDDRELDKTLNRIVLGTSDDLSRLGSPRSSMAASALHKYGQLFENNSAKSEKVFKDPNQTHNPSSMHASTPPIGAANSPWLDPVMFQNLLLAGGLMQQKFDEPAIQELFRNLLIQQELIKEQIKNSVASPPTDHVNNGKASDSRNVMHNLSVLQQHQQQQIQNRLIKNETPDSVPTVDLNDSEDSAVILKIPSFKPVAGSSSSSSGKNGENATDSPQTTPPLHTRSPHTHLSAGISPPIMRHQNNDSQSPPMSALGQKGMLSLREVIAKSITRTFNQQNPSETVNKPSMDQLDQYKRPSISVIKNLGGTDISCFATSPNMISSMRPSNSTSPSSLNNSGKGTRPKRGKYRNYDRDSLVEAVKAVQRGEMSVHRAGSYYGVPHSTLEYKVKERHLMRPRKREPKPQPLDGSGGSTSSTASLKTHDVRSLDKSKSLPSSTKQPMKTPPFPATTSPNGIKMGLFDPSQIQYPPHLFWPHPPGYSGLSGLDFAQRSSGSTAPFSAANADTFFASQMMQRFQEDALRQSNAGNSTNKAGTSGGDLVATAAAGKSKLGGSDRESSLENLYDGTGANGSFLDGIIRYSLDRKTGDSIPQGALLDQLVKNNRHSAAMSGDSDASNCQKRAGSPFNFTPHAIKRERTSSSSGDTDRDSAERDIPKDSLENLLKYNRERPKSLAEELNGAPTDNNKHMENDENSS